MARRCGAGQLIAVAVVELQEAHVGTATRAHDQVALPLFGIVKPAGQHAVDIGPFA
jgi:hypothetical protein